MIRDFKFKKDARQKLFKGVETVYNAVSPTLGPRGKLAAIDRGFVTEVTKDGVTVARAVELEDTFENLGANLVKESASKSGEIGDGTTTSTILSYAMVKEGLKALNKKVSPTGLRNGMEKAVEYYSKELEKLAKPIKDINDIYNIAKVSSNNDEKLASLVKEAFEKVGNEALITVEESSTSETTLTVKEGLTIQKGMISPYFANNEKMESELKNAYVLVTDQTISTIGQLIPILDPVAKSGRPLFIIAEDITGEALPILITNNVKGSLRINAIKAPSYGSGKKDILQDIAIMTGSCFVSQDLGISVSDVNIEMLGSAEKIVSDNENTTIINGSGNKTEIEKRVSEIKTLIENEQNERMKNKLRERLSKFCGGVCVLNIAAQTDAQMKEIKDRVEDTISAVRASIKNGVLTGGGVSLIRVSTYPYNNKFADKEEELGFNIVRKALKYPLYKLAENADMNPKKVVKETIKNTDGKSGYNIVTRKWEKDLNKKVIDPALVEISALKNAFSVANLIINTEVEIIEKNKE